MIDNVNLKHPDYMKFTPIWKKNRDIIDGEEAVKNEGTAYLPKPSGMDQSDYDNYLMRAQFFNATKRTVQSIDGQIFRRKPIVITNNPEYLKSISIYGKSFEEYSKNILREWSNVGRVGTLVDATDSGKPYLVKYNAESIINWKVKMINDVLQFSLVVLCEKIEKEGQDFSHETEDQWRVLTFDENGLYIQQIWKKSVDNKGKENYYIDQIITPIIQDQRFNYIPFKILNTTNEGAIVEMPPLNDLVNINRGHFINSADYENDLHWSGVKTPIFPGWDIDDVIPMGKPIAVGVESKPFMLESSSNSGLANEMTKKEERMSILGSQILAQKGRYMQAAETAEIQSQGESGILSSLADNLDSYFYDLLSIYYYWGGYGEIEEVSFNKDFEPGPADMEKLVKLAGLVGSGAVSYETFFNVMQKSELIAKTETVEDYKKKLIQEKKDNEDDINQENIPKYGY